MDAAMLAAAQGMAMSGSITGMFPANAAPLQPPAASAGRTPVTTWVLAVLALCVGVAGLFFLFVQPAKGTLVVRAESLGHNVEKGQVFVDDTLVCDMLPCPLADLSEGTKSIRVTSDGYASATKAANVVAKKTTYFVINLEKSGSPSSGVAATTAAATGTGSLAVKGAPSIQLSVDGKDYGPLPQDIKELAAGDHKLRFTSGDRYKADERTVSITAGQTKDLGAVTLKVARGKATLVLGTNGTGASVTLAAGGERKSVTNFSLPLDIDTSKQWVLEATKTGFEPFSQPLTFDDGEAEKTFTIHLEPKAKPAAAVAATPGPRSAPRAAPAAAEEPEEETSPPPKKSSKSSEDDSGGGSGAATLNLNSIPPSNCILDGRPLGSTPKIGVSVTPGSHSVVFVHPDHGRKATSVTVGAGETKSAAVRFP